jgi:hypothetical protein
MLSSVVVAVVGWGSEEWGVVVMVVAVGGVTPTTIDQGAMPTRIGCWMPTYDSSRRGVNTQHLDLDNSVSKRQHFTFHIFNLFHLHLNHLPCCRQISFLLLHLVKPLLLLKSSNFNINDDIAIDL